MNFAATKYCLLKSLQVASVVWVAALILAATRFAVLKSRGVLSQQALHEFFGLFFLVWLILWLMSLFYIPLRIRAKARAVGVTLDQLGSVSHLERKALEQRCRI